MEFLDFTYIKDLIGGIVKILETENSYNEILTLLMENQDLLILF